jgi:hypothetical protein
MRQLITISFLVFFTHLSFSQTMNFDFFDSNSKEYNTVNLIEQLGKEYNTEFEESIILLETPNLNDILYLLQNKILDSLDAESLQLIYIVACSMKEQEGGYHTSVEKAKEIMGDNTNFRIRILGTEAKIIFESNDVISKNEIEKILKK